MLIIINLKLFYKRNNSYYSSIIISIAFIYCLSIINDCWLSWCYQGEIKLINSVSNTFFTWSFTLTYDIIINEMICCKI